MLLTSGLAQKIILPKGILTLRLLDTPQADSLFEQGSYFDNQYYFAGSFSQLPAAKALLELNGLGCFLEGRLTKNTYLIRSRVKPTPAFCHRFSISGVSPIPSGFKKDFRLLGPIPQYALLADGRIKTLIGTFKSLAPEKILPVLDLSGFGPTGTKWLASGIISGEVLAENIERLASLPFVTSIQLQNPPDTSLNNIARSSSGTTLLNLPVESGGEGLDGTGVTIGVGDNADPTLHPDVFDRIINHTPGIPNKHGSHVTGTIAGAGILSPRLAGFAPGARVVSQWFSHIWENADIYTSTYNMVATNNSYGKVTGDCLYAGVYDLYSRMLDEQAFEFPQLLHAFASGNDGELICDPFPQSYNTVLGAYQSAKNIITVGRTDYTQVASNTSSSGPVKDGRLKPEITSLGITNSLTGTGTGYSVGYGTSMSSPNIVGGLTLLYQAYRKFTGEANPTGALMKNILLNGARDVGTAGPDFRHGYGTMMLERSIRILKNHWYLQKNIATSQVQDSVISVPANTKLLKVMLYWHDPAAEVLAANTLVHDLDLEVITPGGATIFPKVLNPAPASVMDPATQAADHTNNSEQVLITDPVPGNYTIRVKGTEILTSPVQPYTISFDYVPSELRFTNPLKGIIVESGNIGFPIAWEDEGGDPGTYTLAFSTDNGANWTDIVSGLKDSTRLYFWQPGNIRSNQALLRITKGSLSAISQPFVIIPNVSFSLAGNNDQCYSYFRINWTPLTPAEGETIDYIVLLKRGVKMDSIATVNAQDFYVIPNLNPDSTYYAAVIARINGVKGTYATALRRRPNTGFCVGNISDGNLALDSIIAPLSGRLLTSSAPGNNAPVMVRMRNLDNVATSGFTLKYNINGGIYTEAVINTPVGVRATYTHTFPGIDLSAPGTYHITAIVTNTGATDPDQANDTLRSTIKVLPNDPINLSTPFLEDFEPAENYAIQRPQTGLEGLNRWDYVNQDALARLRTFVLPGIALSGQNAITLDVTKASPLVPNPFNQLIGTFNLSGYNVQDNEVRLGFAYKHHGDAQVPHQLNKVWVRGQDTDPWVEVFDLGANQPATAGAWVEVPAINISHALHTNGQQFSTSTQVRFGQYAQYPMADNQNFAGYTFDDVRLMIAANDVEIVSITNPGMHECGMGSPATITIKVANGMASALANVPVRYRLNNGAWANGTVPSVPGRDTVDFSFSTPVMLIASSINTIEAESLMPGDNIGGNNLKSTTTIAQPIVNSFPYYEDFELGDAGFIADGLNSTWELGTPASTRINSAASGTMAWKTRLKGDYNNYESSYLYTPCFNISALAQPMLGFQLAYHIEDCQSISQVCDAAWMEYSLDGSAWQKLGLFGEGENWYDYEPGQVWMSLNKTSWTGALIPLPVHNGTIRLRFVFKSDAETTFEGFAMDNFQIYDGGTLPLDWLWFEAKPKPSGEVLLNWNVHNRKPGESFDLLVSRGPGNSASWQPIGHIPVENAPAAPYTFTDRQTLKTGILYYRINWNKLNGDTLVSPIRVVDLGSPQGNLVMYPNPASNKLMVHAIMQNDKPCKVRILNLEGKVVYMRSALPVGGVLSNEINLAGIGLANGLYMVEVTNGEIRHLGKLVLNR